MGLRFVLFSYGESLTTQWKDIVLDTSIDYNPPNPLTNVNVSQNEIYGHEIIIKCVMWRIKAVSRSNDCFLYLFSVWVYSFSLIKT